MKKKFCPGVLITAFNNCRLSSLPPRAPPPTINLLSCPSTDNSQAQYLHEIQPSYVSIKIHCDSIAAEEK